MREFDVSADGSGQAKLMISKGGSRVGAGRKRIGETRQISLTLKSEVWEEIDRLVNNEGYSQSEAIRSIVERNIK